MFLALQFAVLLHAQAPAPTLQNRITQDFVKFKASDWSEREAGFDDFASLDCAPCNHPGQAVLDAIDTAIHSGAVSRDDLAGQVSALLTKEAAFEKQIQDAFEKSGKQVSTAPPGYSDYLGDLLMAVDYMRDPRSLPALMYFIDTGNMATSAIASFGDPALKQILALIDSPGAVASHSVNAVSLRQSAYRVLSEMVEPKNLQNFSDPSAARTTIKHRLMTAAVSEPDISVRLATIGGLGTLADPDTLALLQTIAAADSTPDPQGRGRFLVREAAQRELTKLKITQ